MITVNRGKLLLMVLLSLSGCDNGISRATAEEVLSRSMAKEVLLRSLDLPKIVEVELKKKHFVKEEEAEVGAFGMKAICSRGGMGEYRNTRELLDNLAELGLIVNEAQSLRMGRCVNELVVVHLTEIGRADLVRDDSDSYYLRSHESTVGEVTGLVIEADGIRALVEYTMVNLNSSKFRLVNDATESNHRRTLVKYDDGWRLAGN